MTMDDYVKSTVLVVDDDPVNQRAAKTILSDKYRIASAISGEQAFIYLERNLPDLILLDINLPGMSGFDTFEKIKASDDPLKKRIPVVFLTSDTDPETETRCFTMGAADFVAKPFVSQVLLKRVSKALEIENYRRDLETMVDRQAERITKIQETVISGLAEVIESRDELTGSHVNNTGRYVELLSEGIRRRGLFMDVFTPQYERNTVKAAVLHDIGKIKISDTILLKPGKLTYEEFETMKLHTVYGASMIDKILDDVEDPEYVQIARDIALHHHERYDGTGYPDRLSGNDIPLCARIMAVADVFDALVERRCYKPPIRPLSTVKEIMEEGRGTQFDPDLTDILMELWPEFTKGLMD